MSGDFEIPVSVTALTDQRAPYPTRARQYAVVQIGMEPWVYGDQPWVRDGAEGAGRTARIVERDIALWYGDWRPVGSDPSQPLPDVAKLEARSAAQEADIQRLRSADRGSSFNETIDAAATLEVMRAELANASSHNELPLPVAARVAERHMLRLMTVLDNAADPLDRIGEHFEVKGWSDGDTEQENYCGFCSHESHGGAPASHAEWPCDEARSIARRWIPEPSQDPGMVEVPDSEARQINPLDVENGDDVTVTGKADRRPNNVVAIINGGCEIGSFYRACGAGVTVTRPVPPLPQEAGAVGTATVRGQRGVRVARSTDSALPWTVLNRDVFEDDVYWFADSEITDYVPLLPGSGVRR